MVSRNNLSDVSTVQAALASSAGSADLFLNETGNHTPTLVRHEAPVIARVKTKRLDDLVDQLGLDGISLLKIDVDGFEREVLEGATRLLSENRIGAILKEESEWQERQGEDGQAIRNWRAGWSFGTIWRSEFNVLLSRDKDARL
jgi:hypothetical protein